MNILFVNYGDFTTNSLNHIGGFANQLATSGHSCVVAVPSGKETLTVVDRPLFIAATFDELLAQPRLFPNGKPADVVHVWTPRENVRRFTLAYLASCPRDTRLFVHLEDNEDYLIETYTGLTLADLRARPSEETQKLLPENLPHPVHYRDFLALADGVTVIIDRLREFVPAGVPQHLLQPGVDFGLYHTGPADTSLRHELGLQTDETVIVFTGSTTFANEAEMRDLYVAVAHLNQRGRPTRLVRTGFSTPRFLASLGPELLKHVLDLGFIEKARLPQLLRLADYLVQPGAPGPFNDFRLPSKLPEFLATGRPVLLPASNLAHQLKAGVEAIVLPTASPAAVADFILGQSLSPALLDAIGAAGAQAARRLFSLATNTAQLFEFYQRPLSRESRLVSRSDAALRLAEVDRKLAAAQRLGRQSELALHASRLEETLARVREELTLTQQHGSNLERSLQEVRLDLQASEQRNHELGRILTTKRTQQRTAAQLTRQHIRNLEGTLDQVRQALSAAETRSALANKRAADTEVAAREKVDDLEQRLERTKGELRQREDKIRRMQSTASWQLTAPLRDLRRWFLDPFLKPKAIVVAPPAPSTKNAGVDVTPLAPAPAQRTYSYTYNIDHPRSWNTTSNRLLVLGWCFENEGAAISGVRIRIGEQITEGTYGSKRLDVMASVGGKKQAEYCGVKVEARLELGEFPLRLEVKHEDGWYCYHETTLHVGKPGDPMELSEYEKWCQQNEALSEADLKSIEGHIARLRQRPVFSVIVPVYNPPLALFKKAITSVREQLYPHWELCLADDCSTDAEVRAYLQELSTVDSRIKVVFREKNGHISLATNTAFEMATGEFLALFDHDDVLHRTALYECAAALDRQPQLKFIYSDEDKIDGEDRRFDPYFKPDWNPDLLHGQNYTSHLSVFQRALVQELGGMRTGFEGSQDWDLTLRIIDAIKESEIHHIPRILYHWRAIPGSTALQISEKSYPVDAAKRALTEHFQRRGDSVKLRTVPGDHWHVQYSLPESLPLVSLIVPTRNALRLVQQTVESILNKTSYGNYEIIVVDNGSDDPAALAYFAQLPTLSQGRARVLRYDAPFNYSAINNFAVENTSGEVIGLINNDVEVINAEWLGEMVSLALRPQTGAVGAMLYYPNNTVQHAGVILGLGGVAGHAFKEFPRGDQGQKNRLRLVQNYSAVTAACLVMRKDRFLEVQGLDAKNLAVAFNDVDLCCKLLQAGYRNVWTPHAELFHYESATRGIEDTPEKKARFQAEVDYMMNTWGDLLLRDPAYNPNLTLVGEDFSPAYLPRVVKTWTSPVSK